MLYKLNDKYYVKVYENREAGKYGRDNTIILMRGGNLGDTYFDCIREERENMNCKGGDF